MAAAAAAPPGAASAELVIGWCIFGLLLLAILAFCWIYVRKYQSQRESEVVSTITAIFFSGDCTYHISTSTSGYIFGFLHEKSKWYI